MASRILKVVALILWIFFYSVFSFIAYLFGAVLMNKAAGQEDRIVAVVLPSMWLILAVLMGICIQVRPVFIQNPLSMLKPGPQVPIRERILGKICLFILVCYGVVTLITVFKMQGLI